MTGHDDDTERTFAALPPARGQGFAQTWWGRAWLRALEDAALDSGQVKTGRRIARAGAVGAVSVRPGRITAVVQDRDRTAHRADVLLAELSVEQWDRLLEMAVERAAHVAALLDREMPPHLVEDAASAGIELLPGPGDLEPECDCGAWDHCGHTAALCYQVARLLDQDPFVLLLMRGRGEHALLGELQDRSATSVEEAPEPEGWMPPRRMRPATSCRLCPWPRSCPRSPARRPRWRRRLRPDRESTRSPSVIWPLGPPWRLIGCSWRLSGHRPNGLPSQSG